MAATVVARMDAAATEAASVDRTRAGAAGWGAARMDAAKATRGVGGDGGDGGGGGNEEEGDE